ncbi:hypothetical protein ACFQ7J_30535 [Streptomyces sp. NPDC056501]|uniref:hypothetical protein n=1 Tax=Streptomyces sp. NPDC056501 TaxID=3345841 RepID=UPI00369E3536
MPAAKPAPLDNEVGNGVDKEEERKALHQGNAQPMLSKSLIMTGMMQGPTDTSPRPSEG